MALRLSEEEFRRHIETIFEANLKDGSTIDLKLIAVEHYGVGPERPDMERFSAIFLGPQDVRLQQGIYPLRHKEIGELNIFLVPIKADKNGLEYEAVFNFFKTKEDTMGDRSDVTTT